MIEGFGEMYRQVAGYKLSETLARSRSNEFGENNDESSFESALWKIR